MFDRVLVAVDGSAPARRAAEFGIAFARRCDAAVDVLHVLERGAERDRTVDRAAQGRELVASIAALAPESVAVETHVVEGQPHEVIVEHADDRGVDLVVMGRHGRTGIGERLLGTVTDRVLRRSPCPVLAVPGGGGDDAAVDYGDVLVTTDGSENAERAAPYAAAIARWFGATLHLLTVVDVDAAGGLFDAGGVSEAFVERLEARGREATGRLERAVRTAGDEAGGDPDDDVDVESAVVRGVPHEGIGDYAAEHGIDLIVISSEGTSNLAGRYLGSVTDRVLRTVPVPVLVVP